VAAWAEDVDDVIRMRVEELHATGVLEVAGEPLASRVLLPRIYENREFEPAWSTLQQIDALFAMIAALAEPFVSPATL
jgi:hypothetical protein